MNEKKSTETVEVDPGMSVMPEEPGLMDVPTVIPELDSMLAEMSSALPAYQTTTWKNKPSTETPVDAAAMTRIEQRLVDLTNAVNGLRDSVGRPIVVEIGDTLIGDQGFFSLATVPAFMSAVGNSLGKVVRTDLSSYVYVRPVAPFAVFKHWLIGQPGSTIVGLKVAVWSRA